MNRRGFFKTLAAATAGFTILPPATTYERVWKATRPIGLGCKFYDLPFDARRYMGEWQFLVPPMTPWLDLVKKHPFPVGVSETIRTIEYTLCQQ